MILFGPSGNSEQFYEEGFKHTYEAMAWVAGMGLNAYEYSFGRGVRIGEQTAAIVKEEAQKNGIAMSVHAPYFINLATDDEEKRQKNLNYFLKALGRPNGSGRTGLFFTRAPVRRWTGSRLYADAAKFCLDFRETR